MSELLFPVVGAVLVFAVIVPALSLASRAGLYLLSLRGEPLTKQESPLRLLLVIGPSLIPITWLISATIHQSEDGAPLAACAIDHLGGELCRDVMLFGAVLFGMLAASSLFRSLRDRLSLPRSVALTEDASEASARVAACSRAHVGLNAISHRIHVVDGGAAPACTRGIIRPRVEISRELVDSLEDDELTATLLHEMEHARAWDPLRLFLAQVALSLNPLRRLLDPELARYHFAREALCDRRAVEGGAEPLALARSIVAVATPGHAQASLAALGGCGVESVRLRVQLLLTYAEHTPEPVKTGTVFGGLVVPILLVGLAPHFVGVEPLDRMHQAIELSAIALGIG